MLRSIAPDARDGYVPLLLLADESEQQVRSYLRDGELYAFFVDGDGQAAAVTLAIAHEPGVVELKAVAVRPELQGRGVGRAMLREVLAAMRAARVQRVIVGTANAGVGQLAFYQKAGFRLLAIERDFFSPARGYPDHMEENGIRLRDMVWMDLALVPRDPRDEGRGG